ncbi:MAG: hypothetical protein IT550_10305 [Novosphingobium sp.]|jgi:hypothetical protein|nr:hypothetical protein [Novosphingobium sp.]
MFKQFHPNAWFNISLDMWGLGVDSAAVIAMRMAKLSRGGPAAAEEATRMIVEKAESLAHVQSAALTGAMGHSADAFASNLTRHLSTKVRANKRRLSREKQG